MTDVSRRPVLAGLGATLAAAGTNAGASRAAASETATAAAAGAAGQHALWTNTEPSRWWWMTTRMIDTAKDPKILVDSAVAADATMMMSTVGGQVAFYPSKIQYHIAAEQMPPGHDFFGELAAEARRRGVRVGGRTDFSRVIRQAYVDHPDWFFKKADGSPAVDTTDRFLPCMNGGWYREHAPKIMAEVLQRYPISAMFVNNFASVPRSWGDQGLCHCVNCEQKYRARYGRAIPATADDDYRTFMNDSVSEASAVLAEVVHRMQPECLYFNDTEPTDGEHSESRTSIFPGQLWPYNASTSANSKRNSKPDESPFHITVGYAANALRLATMPKQQTELELYQTIAHGLFPVFTVGGGIPQEDTNVYVGAKTVFAWHKANEDLYVGQRSAARVLLLRAKEVRDYPPPRGATDADQSLRGIVRILSEKHIPFAISDNTDPLRRDPKGYDLVIHAPGSTADIQPYLNGGGRVIFLGRPPAYDLPKPVREWSGVNNAYFRIHDRELFPGSPESRVAVAIGRYTEFPPEPRPILTFIPPHLSEMAETAQMDMVETDKPGLLLRQHGSGRFAYVPWDVAGIYYRHGLPIHADLLGDLVDHMLPVGRQLQTTAHPLVEAVLMRQDARNRHLLHLINASGQTQINYMAPVPMRDVEVRVAGRFRAAESRALKRILPVTTSGGYARFVIPELKAYDAIVLT